MTDSERAKVLVKEVSYCLLSESAPRACAEVAAALEAARTEGREQCLRWLEDSKSGAYRSAAKQMRDAFAEPDHA